MWRHWSALTITTVAVIGIQTAYAAEISNNPTETEGVTVTGEATGSLTDSQSLLRNLTNQHYAASIDVIADARTEPNPEIFHPSDGRSFYGGVSWSW